MTTADRVNHGCHMSDTAAMAEAPSGVGKVTTKWAVLPRELVDGGEIIIFAIKPSMWRPVFDSAPWLVTALLLALTLTILGTPFPGVSLAVTAELILLVGFARLAYAVMQWVPTWYLLTNRRVIDVHGVRIPRIWSCLLVEVRNTSVGAHPAEKVVRLGSISFRSAGPEELIRMWKSIARPEEIHARIRKAIENAIDEFSLD